VDDDESSVSCACTEAHVRHPALEDLQVTPGEAVIVGCKSRCGCQANEPNPVQAIAKRANPPRYGMNPTMVRISKPTSSPSSQARRVAPDGFSSIRPRKAPTQIFAR